MDEHLLQCRCVIQRRLLVALVVVVVVEVVVAARVVAFVVRLSTLVIIFIKQPSRSAGCCLSE